MDQHERRMADTIADSIRNTRGLHEELTRRVIQHIRFSMGYADMNLDFYRQELAAQGDTGIASQIQTLVREYVYECVALRLAAEEAVPLENMPTPLREGPMARLIITLFDFGNDDLWTEIAEAWVPGASDYGRAIGELD